MPYMYAVYVTVYAYMPYTLIYEADVRVSRLPYMYALYVCLICMPYMYAVYVCRICYRVCVYAVYVDI
jgi:hypothetical protein